MVRKQVPVKLLLLGHGILKEVVRRTVAEMGLGQDVAIIDFTPQPFRFVAHADLFVLASHHEGHPLALLESLACGVPVVSTNWAGVKETIQHGVNGIICPMSDEAFASGILTGLRLGKSKAMQAAAMASAEKYDVPVITAKYESLLSSLIPAHNRAGARVVLRS